MSDSFHVSGWENLNFIWTLLVNTINSNLKAAADSKYCHVFRKLNFTTLFSWKLKKSDKSPTTKPVFCL